jgi:hypothetical protein
LKKQGFQLILMLHSTSPPNQGGNIMHIAKENIPVQIDVPGATARQQIEFGHLAGYEKMGAPFLIVF